MYGDGNGIIKKTLCAVQALLKYKSKYITLVYYNISNVSFNQNLYKILSSISC